MNNRKTVYYWLRVINDLSQEEVASKLSIPLSYIQELEFGSKKPSKELLSEYSDDNRRSITIKYSHGGEGELYGAIPSCRHEIIPRCSGGVYCSKCSGWSSF